jgi:transcriptional regulator with XRE-family HTH domain
MTIEETIGRRMRYRRNHLGLTQKEVGERLAEHLGKPWSPQAVSIAESGGRDFRAVDLVAVALVLETTPNFLTDWDTPMDADTLNRLQSLYRNVYDAWVELSAAVRWMQKSYLDPETGEPTFVLDPGIGGPIEEILVDIPPGSIVAVAESEKVEKE